MPTKDGSLLVLLAMDHVYTIPVYLRQVDAEAYVAKTGGQAVWHPWSTIRARSLEAGTDGVDLQCGYPEEMGLPRSLVGRLAGETEPDPLEVVEKAVANGTLTAEALWPKLTTLDRIWVLSDKKGAPISTDKVFDCFTSLPLAERFRVQHEVKGVPHFVKAEVFFRKAAAKGLKVGINRCLEASWSGTVKVPAERPH